MKSLVLLSILACAVVVPLQASISGVDFNTEFPAYTLLHSIVSPLTGTISGVSVKSAVYGNGSSYVYLYQIANNSVGHTLDRLTIAPFEGLSASDNVGYLTSNEPAGFSSSGVAPVEKNTGDLSSYPTLGFYFRSGGNGTGLPGGKDSAVLYVVSNLSWSETVSGNVINGGVAFGNVLGAVPEPLTISLFGLGSVFVLKRRKR